MSAQNSSYQKENTGGYQPIHGSAGPTGTKKWLYGVIVIVVVGAVGFFSLSKPGAATDAAVAKAALPTSKSGKLKLFDENSKFFATSVKVANVVQLHFSAIFQCE